MHCVKKSIMTHRRPPRRSSSCRNRSGTGKGSLLTHSTPQEEMRAEYQASVKKKKIAFTQHPLAPVFSPRGEAVCSFCYRLG